MAEGCRFHKERLGATNWIVPKLELTETREPTARTGIETAEIVPKYDGKKWIMERDLLASTTGEE